MFKWKKLGRIFNPSEFNGKYWLDEYAQAPATLIFENFVRVYFSCRSKKNENDQFVSYTAFIDLDRKNLMNVINIAEEPILEPVKNPVQESVQAETPNKAPKVKKKPQEKPVKSTGPIEVDLTKPRHIDLLEIPDRDTRRLSADERLSRGITQ